MLSNLHTHSTYSDGKNTPEEIVRTAIMLNFDSIGFSDHGHTSFDLRYCTRDTESYIKEICRLKDKYNDKIQVYLGVEEDSAQYVNRDRFDYIIGASHYFIIDGAYYDVDASREELNKCLAKFSNDPVALAHSYYAPFCKYIKDRKPDIIGHFDLMTKFDELDTSVMLNNKDYLKVSEDYISSIVNCGCIFEVNTGAISRGYRTKPYPNENLLRILKKNDAKIILSSDSHKAENLSFKFDETRKYLKDIGFRHLTVLYNGSFISDPI